MRHGRRIDRAFLGRLAFGPNPFGVPGRRIDRAFLGRLAFGPNPFGALGLGRMTWGTEPGPMVPTTPHFRGVSLTTRQPAEYLCLISRTHT